MIDLAALLRHDPQLWFESKAVIRLTNGRVSEPGQLRANVLQRRIFALARSRRMKGKPCFGIGLKPRKRGFSTAVAALHYHHIAGQPAEGVIIGNKRDTSETVYRMMALFAKEDEMAKKGEWSSPANVKAETMEFAHGSKVSLSTALGRESVRGMTPQAAHGTEVAHWEQDQDVFLAMMNALPDDPNVMAWLESTPAGKQGAFHARWENARWPTAEECPEDDADYWRQWESNCPDQPDAIFAEWEFVRVFAAWFEFDEATLKLTPEQQRHIEATLDERGWYRGERALIQVYGNIDERSGEMRLGKQVTGTNVWEQLAWRRMTIQAKCGNDPAKFDQEYPRDPESCFLASGRQVFDADALAYYQSQVLPGELGTLDSNIPEFATNRQGEKVTWRGCGREEAIFQRWEAPRRGCRYLCVLDTAEGKDQTKGDNPDRHSALVIRRAYSMPDGTIHKARVVARLRPPSQVPIHALVELVHRLQLYYNALVIPEMNNSGLAYITGARTRGTLIWKRQEWIPKEGRSEEKLGWRTTDHLDYGGVRTLILDALGGALRERAIDLHCPNIVNELSTFVDKHGRKEAESGKHDDDVLALAIGLYNIDSATAYDEAPVERQMPRDLVEAAEAQNNPTGKGGAHFW